MSPANALRRPAGVTVIAGLFLLVSAYLVILGVIRLVSPGAVSLSLAAPWLGGLALAGPYMFLVAAAAGALVGCGLLRLNNYARWAAVLMAIGGILMLVDQASEAALSFSPRFFWVGAMVMARAMVVWYLWQGPTAEKFLSR